jgi:hypothetical protein
VHTHVLPVRCLPHWKSFHGSQLLFCYYVVPGWPVVAGVLAELWCPQVPAHYTSWGTAQPSTLSHPSQFEWLTHTTWKNSPTISSKGHTSVIPNYIFNCLCYTASNGMVICNNELGRMLKEAVILCFKVGQFSWKNEEIRKITNTHDNRPPG